MESPALRQCYNDLWRMLQGVHTLMARWCFLCESPPGEPGRFDGTSLPAFLHAVRTEQHEIEARFAALTQALAFASTTASGSYGGTPLTMDTLAKMMAMVKPFLDAYPDLDMEEFWTHFGDNTHHKRYPLAYEPGAISPRGWDAG